MVFSEIKLSEKESNARLIEAVRKQACLYDASIEDYNRREKCEEAWEEVAHEVGDSEMFCRNKWNNIRTGFTRSLKYYKPTGSTEVSKKRKYYLYDNLEFLLPHVKHRTACASSEDPHSSHESISNDLVEHEIFRLVESVARSADENLLKTGEVKEESSSSNGRHNNSQNDQRSTLVNKPKNEDAITLFLSGLMPDIIGLSTRSQRKFKFKVVNLLAELYEEDEHVFI